MKDELATIEPTGLGPAARNAPASVPALQEAEPQPAARLKIEQDEIDDLIDTVEKDKSDNTRQAYKTQQGLYEMWARSVGIFPAWPANPENIMIWLRRRSRGLPTQAWETTDPTRVGEEITYIDAKGDARQAKLKLAKKQKNNTLMAALSAIKAYHVDNALPFDDKHAGLVRGIKGLRRSNVAEERQMAALKPKLINKILKSFAESERKRRKPCARDIRDAALLSMLYAFAMRRSELQCLDYAELSDEGCGVLTIDHEKATRLLYKSKTNQEKATKISALRERNPRMFAALERWIKFAGIEPGTPLMRSITPKRTVSKKRLSGDGIHNALRAAITRYYIAQGTDPEEAREYAKKFGGHSGRVGFVVTAKEAGAPNASIQARTDQLSDSTTNRYGKTAENTQNAADKFDGVGL